MRTREAHQDLGSANQQESARFCVRWGKEGSFDRQTAVQFLNQVEAYWDVMTGRLGFDQTRGWHREKRHDCKMNIYIVGTGLGHPGEGCYLGCDPEGIHYVSTTPDFPTMAHELGHLAEMGTYGFINHPQVGWTWESCSQWILYFFHNDKPPGILHWLDRSHEPLDNFETRYDSWLFFHYLQKRFGESFVGTLWSIAQQDELPFQAVQRAVPTIPFADIYADFAARCTTWDFEPYNTLSPWLRAGAGDHNGWSRFVSVTQDTDGRLSPSDRQLCWFGFHVVDLRAWLPPPSASGRICIHVQAGPHPSDWRAALVRVQADGRLWRVSEGWNGDKREFDIMHDDLAVMLVVCPVGRHDDKGEPPKYSVSLSTPAAHTWACTACTYRHQGRESQFLSCAMCATSRE